MITAALAVIVGLNGALPPAQPESHPVYPAYVLPAEFQGPVVYPAGYEPLFYVQPQPRSYRPYYPHHERNAR